MSTYRPTNRPITQQRDVFPQPITALSFDPVSDALWSGSNSGGIVAYYSLDAIRGVSFPVGGTLAVKKIIVGDTYVRAHGLGSEGVGSWNKGGVNKWYFRSQSALTTFSNVSSSSHVLAAALASPELAFLNDVTGDVVRRTPVPSMINHMHLSHTFLLTGSLDGYIRTHDPRGGARRLDGGAESSVFAHAGGVQGLQSSGNYVYTIGWGYRQSHPVPDPLVKVYDLRTMRPLPPLPFSDGPSFISTLPKRDSSVVIVSNQGLINIVDISNPSASEFYQLDTASIISSIAVSPTGAYLAFGDSDGAIHLMTAVEGEEAVPFNGFDGKAVEWADRQEPLPEIEWNDSTPLNAVGLPHYNSLLLSSWTPNFISGPIKFPPPATIPPQILSTMKLNDNIAYAALPKELRGRRNMVAPIAPKDTGRFRSGKPRKTPEIDSQDLENNVGEIPRAYRQVEIEYSKFGVEDFDFGFYNKTRYSGLETHILNSYTNPIVQVMHYLQPVRRLAKSHITTNCPREHCLLCELGFVARMLEDAKGTNCQASNFCKTVGVLAQTKNLIELIDYGRESAGMDYAQIIQLFHRFLIDHLIAEGDAFPYNPIIVASFGTANAPAPAPMTQILGIDAVTTVTCLSCRSARSKGNLTHVLDMIYPPRKPIPGEPTPDTSFPGIVRNSLLRQMTYKATCSSCKQYAPFESHRSIPTRELPPILSINTSIFKMENSRFWADTRRNSFLKPRIELSGQVDGVDDPESVIYEIRAIVAQVMANNQRSHLVAIVKVPDSKQSESPWYVFNDFVVRNISEDEALRFPDSWKVPAVVYMERVDLQENLDFSGLPDEIDSSALSRDTNISINRDNSRIKHESLSQEELPQPGTLVSIDAEFVSMQQEETEYRSDGAKKVIRPARLSLARVSVLRGNGPKEGVPFIDDHIHTSEIIVDYLTEYSGVKFGDLDPQLSPYTLTPLKLVYKKLRLLVDRGCIFIGHGLSKDFRIINIFVPPEQVIDTVDLYFIKSRQRRLSLKFLTWFVLKESIQTDMHDSIEDARSALRLYKSYHDFEEQGIFDEKLDELYREGKQYNWKPPGAQGVSISPTMHTASPAAAVIRPQFSILQGNIGFGPSTNFSPTHFGGISSSFFGSSSSPGPGWDR